MNADFPFLLKKNAVTNTATGMLTLKSQNVRTLEILIGITVITALLKRKYSVPKRNVV